MDRCIKSITIGETEYAGYDYFRTTFVITSVAFNQIVDGLEAFVDMEAPFQAFDLDGLSVMAVGRDNDGLMGFEIDGGQWYLDECGQLAVTYPKDAVQPEDGSIDFDYEIPADAWMKPVRAMKALLTLVKEK